jgi:hypothetical protein
MRRLATLLAAAALVALLAGATPVAPTTKPLTTAKVVECLRDATANPPEATFRGSMRRALGADHMGMRFTLQERLVRRVRRAGQAVDRWKNVKAPGLGVWRMSRTGVRMFAYRQNVVALAEGSSYRVVIAYRWYDADGVILKRAKRRSPACRPAGLPSAA